MQFDPAKQAAIYALFNRLNPDSAPVSKNTISTGSSKNNVQASRINGLLSKLMSQKIVSKNETSASIVKKRATDKRLSKLLKQKVKRKNQNG